MYQLCKKLCQWLSNSGCDGHLKNGFHDPIFEQFKVWSNQTWRFGDPTDIRLVANRLGWILRNLQIHKDLEIITKLGWG